MVKKTFPAKRECFHFKVMGWEAMELEPLAGLETLPRGVIGGGGSGKGPAGGHQGQAEPCEVTLEESR